MAQESPWDDILEEDMDFVEQIWPRVFGVLLPEELKPEVTKRV